MKIVELWNNKDHTGESAFRYLSSEYLRNQYLMPSELISIEEQLESVANRSQSFLDDHVGSVGHYFRNLYQILKYVDGMGHTSFSSPNKSTIGMEIRRAVRLYRTQRDYANILRAQLSSSEVACLFLNCLSDQGSGLKYYVEKYSMLKTIDLRSIGSNLVVKDLYHELAYADFEEMDMKDVIGLVRRKYESRESTTKDSEEEITGS